MSNCGQGFQKELATPGFQSEVKSILIGVRVWGGPLLSLVVTLVPSLSSSLLFSPPPSLSPSPLSPSPPPSPLSSLPPLPSQPYSDPRVSQRLKELLASWTVEFKSAPHMKYIHNDILTFTCSVEVNMLKVKLY